MIFLYKVKLCKASLAEINCSLETAIKDLFSAAKLTVFTMLLFQRISWIQKSCKTKTFTKKTTTRMMMMKLWLVWNSERKFTWPFTNYEGGNDPETGKIPNGNRTGLTFAKTGRNALSIKLLESRPLGRSFPLSCLYSQFKICHFIYFHSCLRTERCNEKKLIHILNYFSVY